MSKKKPAKKKKRRRCAAAASVPAGGASPTISSDSGPPPLFPAPEIILSAKHARFVAEYLIDGNAAAAARRIGSSAKRADQAGYEYLSKPEIAAAVKAGQAQQLETAGITKERLLQELGAVALVNGRDYWNADGTVKAPWTLTEAQGAALAGFEVLIKNAKAGDGITDTVHKFKLWDKVRALELYMKHYGMLVEKVELKTVNADARVARLVAARKRTS